jgi:hypothetical protein
MTTLVKPLFDLPETVSKTDYVEKLTDAVAHAERTTRTFVVTPSLKDAFGRSLQLIGSAVRDGKSQATYLKGSFGSGKSHFMALLSLLLDDNGVAWSKPELHELREPHGFVRDTKLLQLHFHMIGAKGIESAIFSQYLKVLEARHPDADLPALFADEELFVDADNLLAELGDAKFFEPMNALYREEGEAGGGDDEWGDFAERWNRKAFERARHSQDPTERAKLFSDLVRARFTSYARGGTYVDIDRGLAVMSDHAKGLGYDGIVLFLDELILWLAHRASERGWLNNEVQKMVKLVEAQESKRAIPIVSFIAQQRDISEMVGDAHSSIDTIALHDSVKHWSGRFGTIELPDSNLHAIVEQRILRPVDEGAKATLDKAFEALRRKAGTSWDAMVGDESPQAFRQVYPFNPALVQALVGLSNTLQRQRTAIKLLVELLVEHMEDLEAGEVMAAGDLFDVMAGGEQAADGLMRNRFESAKRLYEHELLPIIRSQRKTDSPEKCQRLRDDHLIRIGCSNCPERACRSDNRLIKTLLIAALVPNVKALKDLNVLRLVQLNFGAVRTPIQGAETDEALRRLRGWAAENGQVRIGGGKNPTVAIQLEGVPLKPILAKAQDRDQPGARQRLLRDLLFEAMEIDLDKLDDLQKEYTHTWRKTRRKGRIRFGNVRKMGSDQLTCAPDHDFQVIVDYPFDEPQFGPNDDLDVLVSFEEEHGGSWTVVWLPHFFSKDINDQLGELVVINHILESDATKRSYLGELRREDRAVAEQQLENLQNQKKNRLLRAMSRAYGQERLKGDAQDDIDPSEMVDQHVRCLKPGAQLVQRATASLRDALEAMVDAALDARYPRHPKFKKSLGPKETDTLVERFGKLVDTEDKRMTVDPGVASDMGAVLGELGLVSTRETVVTLLRDQTLQRLEQARLRDGTDRPTVGQLRRWLDDSGTMGLLPLAEDLVIRCYARAYARTFTLHGKPYPVTARKGLADEVELELPDLPDLAVWDRAYDKAATLFGLSLPSRARHGDNLKGFEAHVTEKLKVAAMAAGRAPELLKKRLAQRGHEGGAARLTTMTSAQQLVDELHDLRGRALVEAVERFEPQTSASALQRQLIRLDTAVQILADDLVFGPFAQLGGYGEKGRAILDRVDGVLTQDELNKPLSDLRQLANEALGVITPPPPEPLPDSERERRSKTERIAKPVDGYGNDAVRRLELVFDELKRAVEEHGDAVRIHGTLTLEVPK